MRKNIKEMLKEVRKHTRMLWHERPEASGDKPICFDFKEFDEWRTEADLNIKAYKC